jgi:hypothetical protein
LDSASNQKHSFRGWGQGGEMNQALYAHMNNKRKMKKKQKHSFVQAKDMLYL